MKRTKLLFPLLMAIVMMAMSPQKVWATNGTMSTTTIDGKTYYQISDRADLDAFCTMVANNSLSINGILTADIDCNNTALTNMRIGDSSHHYKGIFNGNNKTIRNFYIPTSGWERALFGYTNGATIKNLTVTGNLTATGNGTGHQGSVVGKAVGSSVIENVTSSVNINIIGYTGYYYVGGIVGECENSTIRNCAYTGTIKIDKGTYGIGGIAGDFISGGQITGCKFSGKILLQGGDAKQIGGIVGYAKAGSISDCGSTGTIQSTSTGTCSAVGGIVGQTEGTIEVSQCWGTGTVDAGNGYDCIGGIVGFCTYQTKLKITSCCFTGTLKSNNTTTNLIMGGILGAVNDDNGGYFQGISNCFAAPTLTYSGSSSNIGGIAGIIKNKATTKVANNYYDSNKATRASNTLNGTLGTNYGRTTAQCNSGQVCYELNGSTSGTTWRQNITSGTVDSYPVLDQTHNKVYNTKHYNCSGTLLQSYTNSSTNYTDAHSWGTATWTWGNDGKSATCKRTCSNNSSHTSSKSVTLGNGITSAVQTASTCTTKGTTRYTATATVEGTQYTDSKDVSDIPAIGHGSTGYTETYSWSGTCYNDATKDTKKCIFTLKCNKCSTNVVNGSSLTCTKTAHTDATCTATGQTTYSATGSYTSTNSSYNYSATKTNNYTIAIIDHVSYSDGFCNVCNAWETPSGNGTASSPYIIKNQGTLLWFGKKCRGTYSIRNFHALQTNDIVYTQSDNWYGLGTYSNEYVGIYNGGGHTICGLRCNASSDVSTFGHIGDNGKVMNLGIINVNYCTSGTYCSSAIARSNYGTIENCYATGSVKGYNAAGICSDNSGNIKNCYSTVTFTSTNCSYPIAYSSSGVVTNCYHTSTTSASDFSSGKVCYLLNNSTNGGATWYQNLASGGDAYPVLTANDSYKVYKYTHTYCNGTQEARYTNSSTQQNTSDTHTFTNYTYNNDATCVKNGTKTASCDYGCGTTDTKDDPEHPVTGHSFTNYTYNNDATCVKNGTKTASCDNGCGTTDTKDDPEHPATGHSFVNGANCTVCDTADPAYTLDKELLNTALKAISDNFTLTFDYSAPAGATQVAALNSGNTIYLYKNTADGNDYTVAHTTSGAVIMAPADCKLMFLNVFKVTNIAFNNFNTSNVTDMGLMFQSCINLTSLDMSKFNTEKVTDMSGMFVGCNKIQSLDLSRFNTSRVTNMSWMFDACFSLQSLSIGNLDMSSVDVENYGAGDMFTDCDNLTTLTLKSVPYLADETFNTQFSGEDKTVNYELDDNSVVYTGTNYLPAATTLAYRRTMTTKWGTLVLPFDVPADQEEYDLYSIIRVEEEELTLERPYGILSAGTPVLIRMSEAGKDAETGKYNLHLESANETLNTSGALTSENVEGLTLTGTYSKKVLATPGETSAEPGYIINNDAFWSLEYLHSTYPDSEISIGAFRAYLANSTPGGAAQLRISAEEATALEVLNSLSTGEALEVFDLNGRRLDDLRQGVNIIKKGNKSVKIIVK